MKSIYAFLAGIASAIGLAWLYEDNPDFRKFVDNAGDKLRSQTRAAAETASDAAQSAGENVQRKASSAADAARRAVFTRTSAPPQSGGGTQTQSSHKSTTPSSSTNVDLNACSREDLIGAGLADDLADKILENRPYRNKLDLVSRLVIPEADYASIKHFIFVQDDAADEPIKVAS